MFKFMSTKAAKELDDRMENLISIAKTRQTLLEQVQAENKDLAARVQQLESENITLKSELETERFTASQSKSLKGKLPRISKPKVK